MNYCYGNASWGSVNLGAPIYQKEAQCQHPGNGF